MNEPEASLPPWLHDIFLGYGDPGAAHYLAMEGKTPTVDFKVSPVPSRAPCLFTLSRFFVGRLVI